MKAAGLNLNLLEYWILVAVRLPDAQSGASTNYLHRTPGDGPLLGRPPFLKRYATGSSLEEARQRYASSAEELRAWERHFERHGVYGLHATRVQLYRKDDKP